KVGMMLKRVELNGILLLVNAAGNITLYAQFTKMIAQIQMIQPLIPQQEMVMVQAIQAIQEAIPHFQQLVTKIPCFRFYRGFLARNSNANSPQNNQSEITIKTAEVYSFFIDFSCFC
ncbi:hypothetical protein BS613_15720, partial [Listeria monocytogenes]